MRWLDGRRRAGAGLLLSLSPDGREKQPPNREDAETGPAPVPPKPLAGHRVGGQDTGLCAQDTGGCGVWSGFEGPGDLHLAWIAKRGEGFRLKRVERHLSEPGLAEGAGDEQASRGLDESAPSETLGARYEAAIEGTIGGWSGGHQPVAQGKDGVDQRQGVEIECGSDLVGELSRSPDADLELLAGVAGGKELVKRTMAAPCQLHAVVRWQR